MEPVVHYPAHKSPPLAHMLGQTLIPGWQNSQYSCTFAFFQK